MTYFTQSQMVYDTYLIARAAACAATLRVNGPQQWAVRHIWELVATPGWVEAYKAAGGIPEGDPAALALTLGADPDVVTDAMILTGVQLALGIPPTSSGEPGASDPPPEQPHESPAE